MLNRLKIDRIICLLLLSLLGACRDSEEVKRINLDQGKKISVEAPPERSDTLKIVVGAMITPEEGFAHYQHLLEYIGKKMNRSVEFIAQTSYREANDLLRGNKVTAAFVCGKPYVDGHDHFGLEILAAPRVKGATVYYSHLIVHKDSPYQTLKDLRGKVFAFADPQSNSGWLVPTWQLAKMGETADSFFGRYFYTYGHDKSIKSVAQKVADAAAVDSLIYEHQLTQNSKYATQTRIIDTSQPFGIPPVVVPKALDPAVKSRLRRILLNIHQDPEGKTIITAMGIDRFLMIDDSAYDGIRDMKRFLGLE